MSLSATDWSGQQLSGRYVVREKLGEGGMGSVYRAHDQNLDCDVVIKVPHAAMLQDTEFAERFAREIRSLVQLSHPHIVKIIDVGQHEGLPFAVMQYLAGGSLERRSQSASEEDDVASLANWLPDVAKALDFVHREGYVHRDIKPANILFDKDGNAFLGDFGIAKVVSESPQAPHGNRLTATGLALGTEDYMAPEISLGEPYDGRSDQYSLAVTIYELYAGKRPFYGATPGAVLVEKATKNAPSLATVARQVPNSISVSVDRALSKNPEERFACCLDFAQAVLINVREDDRQNPVPPNPTPSLPIPPHHDTPAITDDVRRVSCPKCGKRVRLRTEMAGQRVKCPACQSRLLVSEDGLSLQEKAETASQAHVTDTGSIESEPPQEQHQSPIKTKTSADRIPKTKATSSTNKRSRRLAPWGQAELALDRQHILKYAVVGVGGLSFMAVIIVLSHLLQLRGVTAAVFICVIVAIGTWGFLALLPTLRNRWEAYSRQQKRRQKRPVTSELRIPLFPVLLGICFGTIAFVLILGIFVETNLTGRNSHCFGAFWGWVIGSVVTCVSSIALLRVDHYKMAGPMTVVTTVNCLAGLLVFSLIQVDYEHLHLIEEAQAIVVVATMVLYVMIWASRYWLNRVKKRPNDRPVKRPSTVPVAPVLLGLLYGVIVFCLVPPIVVGIAGYNEGYLGALWGWGIGGVVACTSSIAMLRVKHYRMAGPTTVVTTVICLTGLLVFSGIRYEKDRLAAQGIAVFATITLNTVIWTIRYLRGQTDD